MDWTLSTRRLVRKACDGEYLPGCNSLGWMHMHGQATPQDMSLAARHYRQACDGKEYTGCSNLAVVHLMRSMSDVGTEADGREAVKLLQLACAEKVAGACISLGKVLESGAKGVPADKGAALGHFRTACARGEKLACGFATTLGK